MALKTTAKRNPGALALIMQQLDKAVGAGAEAGAMQLYENLDAEAGGQGIKYPNLPNRSSTPGQYPIKQSGRLQDMTEHGQIELGTHYFGLAPENEDEAGQAKALEFGNPKGGLVARAPVSRTGMDSKTHRVMREAAAVAARKG